MQSDTDATGKRILQDVATHLFPNEDNPKELMILPNRASDMIQMYNNDGWPNLDEEFCIRIFLWCLPAIY
jgi:hypothetical protein